jgi:hypothetical protein
MPISVVGLSSDVTSIALGNVRFNTLFANVLIGVLGLCCEYV